MCGYPYREAPSARFILGQRCTASSTAPARASRSSAAGSCSSPALEQLSVTESWFATRGRAPICTSTASTPTRSTCSKASWRSASATRSTRRPRWDASARRPASCTGSGARCRRASSTSTPRMRGSPSNLRERRPRRARRLRQRRRRAGRRVRRDGRCSPPGGRGRGARANHRVATIKVGSDELCADRVRARARATKGRIRTATTTTPTRSTCSTARSSSSSATRAIVAGPGSFVAAPPGVAHAFRTGPEGGAGCSTSTRRARASTTACARWAEQRRRRYRCTTVSTNGAPARSGGSSSHANRLRRRPRARPACAGGRRETRRCRATSPRVFFAMCETTA